MMVFNPIIGTLIYLLERKTNSVLLIKRDARPSDDHFGKYNGVGGKLEVDDTVVQGARRELLEETGLTAASLRMRGTISWSNFGPRREEWLGFIFLVDQWEGDVFAENLEGTLENGLKLRKTGYHYPGHAYLFGLRHLFPALQV